MKYMRRLIAAVLFCSMVMPVKADSAETRTCQERLLQYYCYYQSEASDEIGKCLADLSREDPEQGAIWKRIMADWDRLNGAGFASLRAFHDGLPTDDSLCIVVFGLDLNDDGTMKPELISRLETALQAARQYPNAYVAVTGGETSNVMGVSEAGAMSQWLQSNGIDRKRLIVENQSLSTTENAKNTYGILLRDYPQVQQVAAVTSDYHVAFAAVMLQTVSDWESSLHGSREIPVTAGISCVTQTPDRNMMTSQAWGIGLITGTQWYPEQPEIVVSVPETTTPQESEQATLPRMAAGKNTSAAWSLRDFLLGWLRK